MTLSHFETQRLRTTNLSLPVDLRALEYVSPYNDNLVCPICRCPFVDPVLLDSCEHCFCRDCIRQTWTVMAGARSSSEPRGNCPACRAPAQIGPRNATSKIIVNILDELLVECPLSAVGCTAQIKRGEVQDHVSIYCPFASVVCSATDCNLPARRMDLDQGCMHYMVSCLNCRKEMHKSVLEDHWRNECQDREVRCGLCAGMVYYRQLEQHKAALCPSAVVPCPGADYGCENRSRRAQTEVHAKNCALAKLAPVLNAQAKRIEEHETSHRQLTRKLEVLQDGFATIQHILDNRLSSPDNDSADETRRPSLQGQRRDPGSTVTSPGFSPLSDNFIFPQSPVSGLGPSQSTLRSPPSGAPSTRPIARPTDLPEPFSSDFDLATPFPTLPGPYASPLHHLLSMHESLREEMTRMATSLHELDGRFSMQTLNENLRTREEIAYLGAQVAGMGRQVHWLTSSQLQRMQRAEGEGAYGEGSASGAAVGSAATVLRGAARVVSVGREGGGGVGMRRGTSEEGRTKL